jgi:hypothetical protein
VLLLLTKTTDSLLLFPVKFGAHTNTFPLIGSLDIRFRRLTRREIKEKMIKQRKFYLAFVPFHKMNQYNLLMLPFLIYSISVDSVSLPELVLLPMISILSLNQS